MSKGIPAGIEKQLYAAITSLTAIPPRSRDCSASPRGAELHIARLEARSPGPDGCNRAGDLAAWRKRTWRLELIAVLNDEQIRVVDAAGLDRQQDLAGAGRRVWHLLQH